MRQPRPTWLHCVLLSSRLWGATSRGGGIAFTVKNSLQKHISNTASFPCHLTSFDAAQLTLTVNPERIRVFCVYRPPHGKRNKLTDTMFFDQLPNFLEHCDGLTGKLITMGDFNFHFELYDNPNARKLHEVIEIFSLNQSVSKPTHKQGHLLNLLFHRHDENLLRSTKLDHGLTSDHIAFRCELSIAKTVVSFELVSFQSNSKNNTASFKQGIADSIIPRKPLPVLNNKLYAISIKHDPIRRRKFLHRKPTSWYNCMADQLRALKRERRRAEI